MLFNLRWTGEEEWDLNRTTPSVPAASPKGRMEQGKERASVVKFPVLKLFRIGYGEGI